MKKIILFVLFLTPFFTATVSAHSGKPKYHVIIDTDGAIDDMRALSMFLSGNDIRVLAISCSQGSLLPEDVYEKVTSLLKSCYNEGIPVGISHKTDFDLPIWESFTKGIVWGEIDDSYKNEQKTNSIDVLNKVTKNYSDKITLIALGSLKTYADWIRANPEIKNKIDRIIWYNTTDVENGFNYKVSPESYEFITQSGTTVEIVTCGTSDILISNDYLQQINEANTIYSDRIYSVHSQAFVVFRIKDRHLKMWDDFVPLYLTMPVLFTNNSENNIKYISPIKDIPAEFWYESVKDLLASSGKTNNRVFKSFPVDTSLYKETYIQRMQNTIQRYGLIEWKAICLTNEIHGHTGIYSIIGAKAGIRAMEYFNVGVNNLNIISYAGSEPPLSCFNDGLQISTGSTIGQGLITVSDSLSQIPSAFFEFNGQKVIISLKNEVAEYMKEDILKGIEQFGALTDQYWLYIEELAIRYWANYNRHTIFNINKVY